LGTFPSWGREMRTVEVMKEFRDRCKELAAKAKMPEVKTRLEKLALDYQKHLERLEAPPIAPK